MKKKSKIEVDEYKFLCWLAGEVPSAIVIRDLFRIKRKELGKNVRKKNEKNTP